jgi:hypothetical protein
MLVWCGIIFLANIFGQNTEIFLSIFRFEHVDAPPFRGLGFLLGLYMNFSRFFLQKEPYVFNYFFAT